MGSVSTKVTDVGLSSTSLWRFKENGVLSPAPLVQGPFLTPPLGSSTRGVGTTEIVGEEYVISTTLPHLDED